jgi:hypothetical protein
MLIFFVFLLFSCDNSPKETEIIEWSYGKETVKIYMVIRGIQLTNDDKYVVRCNNEGLCYDYVIIYGPAFNYSTNNIWEVNLGSNKDSRNIVPLYLSRTCHEEGIVKIGDTITFFHTVGKDKDGNIDSRYGSDLQLDTDNKFFNCLLN